MILYDAFPDGKQNAFTLSYDDGDLRDVRLMELFRKYELKATFHLVNSVFSLRHRQKSARGMPGSRFRCTASATKR